jgi:hypothetical protein
VEEVSAAMAAAPMEVAAPTEVVLEPMVVQAVEEVLAAQPLERSALHVVLDAVVVEVVPCRM